MRLEARIEELEKKQGVNAQDAIGFDNRQDFFDHHLYFCNPDGKEVLSINLFARGAEQYRFDDEAELWNLLPSGTKFRRSGGGDFEVIDGVMRELHFPPFDGKIAPEVQTSLNWLFGT